MLEDQGCVRHPAPACTCATQRLLGKLLAKAKSQSDIVDKHSSAGVKAAEVSALKAIVDKVMRDPAARAACVQCREGGSVVTESSAQGGSSGGSAPHAHRRAPREWCAQYKISSDDIDKLIDWKHTAY